MKVTPMEVLKSMRNSTLRNYIVPGLDSHLIGGNGSGLVRMFTSSRENAAEITPHSHRFDFACLVLRGEVINQVWTFDPSADKFVHQNLRYHGTPGEFEVVSTGDPMGMSKKSTRYAAGQWYTMKSHEIHSILFSRDAEVLFFEGPQVTDDSCVLLPWVGGEVCDTMDCNSPWMYQK